MKTALGRYSPWFPKRLHLWLLVDFADSARKGVALGSVTLWSHGWSYVLGRRLFSRRYLYVIRHDWYTDHESNATLLTLLDALVTPLSSVFKIPHPPSFRGALNSLSWNPVIKNLKEGCRNNNARITQVTRHFLRVHRRTHNMKDMQCTYKRNIEVRSCNHCCYGKAISACCEWVFVALVIQHPKRMRSVMSSVACPAVQYFFHIISQTAQFSGKKLLNIKCVLWFSLQLLSVKHFSFWGERIEISQTYIGPHVKYRYFLQLLMILDFSRQIF